MKLAILLSVAMVATCQQKDPAVPLAGAAKINSKDTLSYRWIPAGEFIMGCSSGDTGCHPDEKPAHKVRIVHGFWIGETEVTVAAYRRYATATKGSMPPEVVVKGVSYNKAWGAGRQPINNVTWAEASQYCAWIGGRLPSEAEWEYAARGGDPSPRYGAIDEVAWHADNSGSQRFGSKVWDAAGLESHEKYVDMLIQNANGPHEVSGKRPNLFGLRDMLGNVWEWVNDWYDAGYFANSPIDSPTGPNHSDSRVVRGGSFFDWDLRVTLRFKVPAVSHDGAAGFRCVWDKSH